MSIATFYARSRWGSRWGVVDAYHTTPHKGLDIRGISRQAVPVLRSGTIVADAPSPSVGRYITVRVRVSGRYEYDTYCHVVSRGRVGAVKANETLAVLAGWGDAHGSSWSGPHLHLARSTTLTGWAYWGAANLNPEPVVIAALTQSAGGGVTPIEEHDMPTVYKTPNGQNYYGGEFSCFVIGQATADALYDGGIVAAPVTDESLKLIASAANQANDKLIAEIISKLPPTGAGDVDEAALAAALAPYLVNGISDAELAAAVAAIKAAIPTSFKAG